MSGGLSSAERRALRRDRWAIPAIVLRELSKLQSLGRVTVEFDSIEFSRVLGQVEVLPLSTELDFSSDPADEIIAATSVVHGIPLLTRDRKTLKSKLVKFG